MGDHDTLFKRAFSVPAHAAGELRSVLPAELVERLDLDALALVPASFVDAEMEHRHADLLFEASLRGSGEPILLYFLLEHQSTADPLMPFRALVYATRAWERVLRAAPERTTLPPFVTVVVHHGAHRWASPRRLHDLVDGLGGAPELARLVPDVEIVIDDLVLANDEALRSRPLAPLPKIATWLLRDGRDVEAFFDHLDAWADELEGLVGDGSPADLELVLRYILRVAGDVPFDTVRRRIVEVAPSTEEPMASIEEQLIQRGRVLGVEEGRILGVEEGREEGRVEALRETLTRLLRARFGPLAPGVEARIAASSRAELDRFIERLVTAPSVDRVLEG